MSDIIQVQDTRREFIDVLCELAEKDNKICLIVCDVGFNYIEKFQQKFPNRFWNLGTTEMSSVAEIAGMAIEGMKPYFYSMIPFVLFRPYEMVRNAVIHHNANVKLIGVKGSEKYKFLGFSHNLDHDQEDTKLCENIGLDWYIPKTNGEVRNIIEMTYENKKACYIRL